MPAGEEAVSFSRDRGHSSMADHTLGGRDGGFLGLTLLANGGLESPKLVLGQSNHERLEQDDGLSQAGIQVVVVRVHIIPYFLGMQRNPFGEVLGSAAEILAKILDHLLQRAYFVKKLEPVGKQHAIEEAAHPCRMLAPLSVKIGRIKAGRVGNGSVMLGVLRQSAKQAGERLGQQLA